MLSKQQIGDRIWAIYGDTTEEIGRAFMRFQEFYENEQLRGKLNITIKDIENWWNLARKEQDTTDDYCEFWQGFNVPGIVFTSTLYSSVFRQTMDHTGERRYFLEEEDLIKLILEQPTKEIHQSYYIGLSKTVNHVFDHEVAHALYATNHNYKSSQLYNISQLPKNIFAMLHDDLISMGYDKMVVVDEMQAYLSTYTDVLAETLDTDAYNQFTEPFVNTFKSYQGFQRTAKIVDKTQMPS
jgi:hypothetical protein